MENNKETNTLTGSLLTTVTATTAPNPFPFTAEPESETVTARETIIEQEPFTTSTAADLTTFEGRRRSTMKILVDSQSLNKGKIASLGEDLKSLTQQIDELRAKHDPSIHDLLETKIKIIQEYQVLVEQQELIVQEIEHRKKQKILDEHKELDERRQRLDQRRKRLDERSHEMAMNNPRLPSVDKDEEIRRLEVEIQELKDEAENRRKIDLMLGRPRTYRQAVWMGCCEGCIDGIFRGAEDD